MARHQSFQAVMAALVAGISTGHSKHRAARVLRFVFKHPSAHGPIIEKLLELQRRRQLARRGASGSRPVSCDRCGITKKGLSTGNGHGPRCGNCSASNAGGRDTRPIRVDAPRDLRRALADAWDEGHPGRPFSGRQWKKARKAFHLSELAEARAKASR